MAMGNPDWESALRSIQPQQGGGIQPPARPGSMGNIAYAPGAMRGMRRPGTPLARDVSAMRGGSHMMPGGYMMPGPPMGPVTKLPVGYGRGLPPDYANQLIDALRRVPHWLGQGPQGRPFTGMPIRRY